MGLIRLDRAASVYIFHPLGKVLGDGGNTVPILMYHSISEGGDRDVHPYYRTATSPAVFASHMRFLHENNYAAIGMGELDAGLASGGRGKCVVITFDDGFRDFYTRAYPVLRKYAFKATVFLPTGFIGDSPLRFKDRECLAWGEVRELADDGVVFGSHTVTHPQLRQLRPDAIARELDGSKKAIEDRLGGPVTYFSYPYRFPDEDPAFRRSLGTLLNEAGYTHGVTTVIGRAGRGDDSLFLKRLPVNSADDPALFRAKLEGGYDWLHRPQYISKKVKMLMRARAY